MAYDIDALKEDLPNSIALAQFVYTKTQVALDLTGKPKEEQYQVAKNALEGKKVPAEYLTNENPFVDKKDEIPVDELKKLPPRNEDLPEKGSHVHFFGATNIPHPDDPQSDRKVQINFYKYNNGLITYEIMGPLEQVAIGQKMNKYGQSIPEKFSWLDPRTPEVICRRPDGTFTDHGRRLQIFCDGEKGAGIWRMIDKDMTAFNAQNITDPWN